VVLLIIHTHKIKESEFDFNHNIRHNHFDIYLSVKLEFIEDQHQTRNLDTLEEYFFIESFGTIFYIYWSTTRLNEICNRQSGLKRLTSSNPHIVFLAWRPQGPKFTS
jgi:hypothetical protein